MCISSAILPPGSLSKSDAHELIDQFVIKLRIVRFLRTPDYDALFSGDPYWATESIGGMALAGKNLVTRTTSAFCTRSSISGRRRSPT